MGVQTHRWARRAVASAATGCATLALMAAPASSETAEIALDLQGCYLSVAQFEDSPERLRQYVPAAYALSEPISLMVTYRTPQVSGKAAFIMWTYSCDSVAIAGSSTGPTTVSLVGVVIERPDALTFPVGFTGPAGFDQYLVAAFANNGKLADALTGAGLPTRNSPGMEYEREFDALGTPTAATTVPGPHGFGFSSAPVVNDTLQRPHAHHNSFWFGENPETAAELDIRLSAREWLCVGSDCGAVSAPPGHGLAEFFGAPARSDASFSADHMKIDTAAGRIRTAG